MQTELDKILTAIRRVARKSKLAEQIENISLEAGDEKDQEFIRVVVSIRSGGNVEDEVLEGLVTSIEDVVASLDERYPSVRFAEAA